MKGYILQSWQWICTNEHRWNKNINFQEWKSKANVFDGPVEERDGGKCIYNCKPNDGKWCRVNYEKPLFSGKTKGLCFTNGACFGTPDACVDCKEKCPDKPS